MKSLPHRFVALAAAASWLLAGCGKIAFDVEEKVPEQEVAGSPLGGLLSLANFAFPLNVNIESQTRAQGTGPAHSASLKSLELSITTPAGETFEFLDTLTIEISAPGLDKKAIAHLDPVPAQARVSLTVDGAVDLLPYINKGATLTATATGHAPRQTLKFDGRVVITVRV
jgi:hypothetical protein